MNPDDRLADALRLLRAEYLADAPRKVAELWAEHARVQNDGVQRLGALRVLVHRLAGSGGSYGLPAVTERAGDADQFCRSLIEAGAPLTTFDLERLRALIQGIADAFHNATTSE